jgi:hypothetical protein
MEKRFIITFKGEKKELHKQLKMFVAENGGTMNDTVLSFIENNLKNSKRQEKI